MEITVLFFGELQQCTKQNKIVVTDILNSDELIIKIENQFPEIKSQSYRIAVNKILITAITQFKNNDVVAFLPPFAGG